MTDTKVCTSLIALKVCTKSRNISFGRTMSKNLIIVESPAKVKTIKKFLGKNYAVQASVGHIRDLPKKTLGVDENDDFNPQYETIVGKEKVVKDLKTAAAKADIVFLAPDPDREGEAIAWHIAESIKDDAKDIRRIQFNEITAKAVKEAIENPREINTSLFDAQQARRVLDRLVGYKISPLLWKTVKRGISAGRVQSVALKLIVDREDERKAFKSEEYWNFKTLLQKEDKKTAPFKAELHKINNKKAHVPHEEAALALEKEIKQNPFIVAQVEEKERSRSAPPPFITSTLQQVANQKLGFAAKRTMQAAQKLYEGIDLSERGTTALITYMRTDSVRIAAEAQQDALQYIENVFGNEYLGGKGKGNFFKSKNAAQDAHEAIRPIDVTITPDSVRDDLSNDQFKLYQLIWSRFVSSQMSPAVFHDTNVLINCGSTQWKSKGQRILFPGFLVLTSKSSGDDDTLLPELKESENLLCAELTKEQKFTQPPARFTEASLVKELEELGIGRPSTYATIISTLQDREYVRLEDKSFSPTDLGMVVVGQLNTNFPQLMDVSFTAQMEGNLDKVADGDLGWVNLLSDFSKDFNPALEAATKTMTQMKQGIETDVLCPECEKPLVVKFGKAGEFIACSGYPACSFTSNFTRDEEGKVQLVAKEKVVQTVLGECPKCGGDVVLKRSRTGSRFQACSNYPKCNYTASYTTGVKCPKCTEGELAEKSSKRGKIFYGCTNYPKCDFASWNEPVNEACEICHTPITYIKQNRSGKQKICTECGRTEEI